MSGFKIDAAEYSAAERLRQHHNFSNALSLVGDEARLVAANALDLLAQFHGFLPRVKRTGYGSVVYAFCAQGLRFSRTAARRQAQIYICL